MQRRARSKWLNREPWREMKSWQGVKSLQEMKSWRTSRVSWNERAAWKDEQAWREWKYWRALRVRTPLDEGISTRALILRRAADLLTLTRCVLSLVLVYAGVSDGAANLGRDIWLLVAAWTTDMFDGRLSRAIPVGRPSWLGRNDVYVDMLVSLSVLAYLGATGLLPLGLLAAYLLVWFALFLRWGIPPLFAQVFQNPIYLYFVVLTFIAAPEMIPWLLAWGAFSLLIFWRRLAQLLSTTYQAVNGE